MGGANVRATGARAGPGTMGNAAGLSSVCFGSGGRITGPTKVGAEAEVSTKAEAEGLAWVGGIRVAVDVFVTDAGRPRP